MKTKCFFLLTFIMLFSLAIYTNANAKSKTTKSGLRITASENWNWGTPYFGRIDFKFENNTQEWIRITGVRVRFKDAVKNENIIFTSGRDLALWGEIVQDLATKREREKQEFLGAVAAIGVGTTLFADDFRLKAFGTVATIGALESLSIMEFNKSYININMSEIFPRGHLFAKDFVVPPGLTVSRYLVLNTRNHKKIGYIDRLFLQLQIDNNKPEEVELTFRSTPQYTKPSQWQRELTEHYDDTK